MKNILVVTANSEWIKKIKEILDPQGYEILQVDTAEKAREAIESKNREIQFVLYDADIAMSGGMETLLYIKDKYPELPIATGTAMHKDTGPLHLVKEKTGEDPKKTEGRLGGFK
ncbi:MAG: hypothetical protein J7M18_01125 [Candidatus Eremiobacteraeota bacterium]|nr:hypothetical protein [Candidatus Eremiobacteraeota bacterium]